MSTHRWGIVTVHELTPTQAAAIHELHGPADRSEPLHGATPIEVRGPICLDCRVHWRDVHHQPDKPWPCPGIRPNELDGPVVQPEHHLSRQQRRRLRRELDRAGRR